MESPRVFNDVEACVDAIIEQVGKDIKFGMPLGLGKPIHLVNALYKRAKEDSSIKLLIATALTLEKPAGHSSLEKKFLEPFVDRVFGGIPDIEYMKDLRARKVPFNIEITEFFFKAGSFLHHDSQQENYICTNYTHAVRDLIQVGVNVVSQIVAKKESNTETRCSLSCNPDTSLDLIEELKLLREKGVPVAIVGEVNNQLPYMKGHADVPATEFDILLENPDYEYPLFGAPNMAITPADHMIGFNSSVLIKDGGTLQVGIGSLGSALVYSAIMREKNNDTYNALMDELKLVERFPIVNEIGDRGRFTKGLYGCSEMMVEGFMHLFRAGILKREVFDDYDLQTAINEAKGNQVASLSLIDALVEKGRVAEKIRSKDVVYLKKYGLFKEAIEFKGGSLVIGDMVIGTNLSKAEVRSDISVYCLGDKLRGGILMHGGFFLGPRSFYGMLDELTDEEHDKICMTSVQFINHLFDHRFGDQKLKVAQRIESRFINSTMMYTLNGAAVSDGLDNGQVVSGVGGQYNFVAMAHEMDDARSILNLKSWRPTAKGPKSNIVFNYGHCTIPRHLRDIVVTEYGVADLLGKQDKEVYIELIKIADSRFQPELLSMAKLAGKVPKSYELPDGYCHNTPERIVEIYNRYKAKGFFDPFPFGCDFTEDELRIGKALKNLKAKTATRKGKLVSILKALKVRDIPLDLMPLIKRMKLESPVNFMESIEQKLLITELQGK